MNTLPHGQTVSKLAFSYNGTYIATGDIIGFARVFGVKTGQEVFQVDLGINHSIQDICFSPDGRSLAIAFGHLFKVFKSSIGPPVRILTQYNI